MFYYLMLDYKSEVGETREKYKPLFFVTLLLLLGVVYFEITQNNDKQTEVVFNASVPSTEIVVDISGAVINPGVYKLAHTTRLVDLIGASGGVSEDVSAEWVTKNLNLSQKLVDSQKFYIPFEWDIVEQGPVIQSLNVKDEVANVNASMNLNTSSLKELMSLSGIGAIYAQRIIDARPITNIDNLFLDSIISESLVEKIKGVVSI